MEFSKINTWEPLYNREAESSTNLGLEEPFDLQGDSYVCSFTQIHFMIKLLNFRAINVH